MGFIDVEVDGQKLHGGHTELLQVIDHGRMGHTRIRPTDIFRNIGVQHGLPAHMGLIEHRLTPRYFGAFNDAPIEVGGHPNREISAVPVGVDVFIDVPPVRVKQQLLCFEIHQQHLFQRGLNVRVEAVASAHGHAVDETVVHAVGLIGQQYSLPRLVRRLETQYDVVVVRCVDGNIRRSCAVFPGQNTDPKRKTARQS